MKKISTLDWARGKGIYACGTFNNINKTRYLRKGTIVYVEFNF